MRRLTSLGLLLAAALAAGCGGPDIHKPPVTSATPPQFVPARPAGEGEDSGKVAIGQPATVEPEPLGGAPQFEQVPPEENTVLATAATMPAGPYRMGVDDRLEISVYGESDLQKNDVPVRPDGMISFAFVGDVMAAGRTVEALREEMTQRLAQYLRSPQVSIILKQFSQRRVYVGGEVRSPGLIYLSGREQTVLDALYKAGLVTEKANLQEAYIIRANKIVAADFKGLVRGDMTQNVNLADQDIVYVPENTNRFVYVLGEVRRNDAFPISGPTPIVTLLAQAGGFTLIAKQKEIAVIRGGLRNPMVAYVNAKLLVQGDVSQNIMVQPGDIVYVATTALGKYNNFIDQLLHTLTFVFQGVLIGNTVSP
jgi:polysaccharide export outer membrane protein